MTTTRTPASPSWDVPTIVIPISPLLALDHCHRRIRNNGARLLAELDAALTALGITVEPIESAGSTVMPAPARKRWFR